MQEENKNILYSVLLMNIGKMSLSDSLLTTSYDSVSLTDKSRYLKHAVEGEELLGGIKQLKDTSILIRHQYERYGGTGLPDGLFGQKIPLGSRILAVVRDYFSYLDGSITGEKMNPSMAIEKLMNRRGSYYDPDIIGALIEILKENNVYIEVVGKAKNDEVKSWRKSTLYRTANIRNAHNISVKPVIETTLSQLKEGMEIDSVYF